MRKNNNEINNNAHKIILDFKKRIRNNLNSLQI